MQNLGYLLAIFETYAAEDKIKRDLFDLNKMKNILVDKDEMMDLDMEKGLELTTICDLKRVSAPNVKSKHVLICITGFLQESEDKAEFWEHLIAHYKHAEIFALSWNACTPVNFLSSGSFRSKYLKNENILEESKDGDQ